jgi:hypothetical protein
VSTDFQAPPALPPLPAPRDALSPPAARSAGPGALSGVLIGGRRGAQMPIFTQHTISGLWVAATILFLLFVAAIALVIAFVTRDPIPPKKSGKKD